MTCAKQRGLTLVEIAIVLVIIGLLLGSILKGQELINSARVRSLADQNAGIQTAYYGFIDRYRQVPGDWSADAATRAIGQTINVGGNGNGRIDNTLDEAAATWEQLARANFLGGGFTPATATPSTTKDYANSAPKNVFNGTLVLARNEAYTGSSSSERLNLHIGRNIPVKIARELDVKIDDGRPNTGILRLTKDDGSPFSGDENYFIDNTKCTAGAADGTTAADTYDVADDVQDCGQTFLY